MTVGVRAQGPATLIVSGILDGAGRACAGREVTLLLGPDATKRFASDTTNAECVFLLAEQASVPGDVLTVQVVHGAEPEARMAVRLTRKRGGMFTERIKVTLPPTRSQHTAETAGEAMASAGEVYGLLQLAGVLTPAEATRRTQAALQRIERIPRLSTDRDPVSLGDVLRRRQDQFARDIGDPVLAEKIYAPVRTIRVPRPPFPFDR